MTLAAMRKAITEAARARGLELDDDDIEALAQAAAGASTDMWWDSTRAMRETGRSTKASLRAWCSRHSVTHQSMVDATEARHVLDNMPGRGANLRGRGRR